MPKLWVKIGEIIRSTDDVTALAYENVKMKVVDWWSERPCRVITSVRLRDVQPVSTGGTDASTSADPDRRVLHPSPRITYDPASSIISFISDNVGTCVEEFLEEWEKIHKVVSLVRESKCLVLLSRCLRGLTPGC